MKTIKLTQNFDAFVDDDLFEQLNRFTWYYHKQGYAVTNVKIEGSYKSIPMHKMILPLTTFITDHINKDKLWNSRFNLRIVTKRANSLNNKASGAYLDNRSGRYQVSVAGNDIGTFDTKEEAECVAREERKQLLIAELSLTRCYNLHLTDEQFFIVL